MANSTTEHCTHCVKRMCVRESDRFRLWLRVKRTYHHQKIIWAIFIFCRFKMGTYWFLCLKLLFSLSHGLSIWMHVSFSSPLSTHLLLMCSLHVFNSQRYLKSYRFSVKLARTVCCAIFLFHRYNLTGCTTMHRALHVWGIFWPLCLLTHLT